MSATNSAAPVIRIRRWPTERPLLAAAAIVSAIIWIVVARSTVGLVCAALVGVVCLVLHIALMAHVRGSGVRLGPDQFSELYADVERLARRLGLSHVPDTYIMQAGGALNAFATRFLDANIVVLYSDLLDACGDNTAARDMIIARELGHIRAGHLNWHLFLLPASLVPFLGSALSRAREYTCDRIGLAAAGDMDGALLGLTILAAGRARGPLVDQMALVRQCSDLTGGWMTVGEWLSAKPPLVKRLAALNPSLALREPDTLAGALCAAAIVSAVVLPFFLLGSLAALSAPTWIKPAEPTAALGEYGTTSVERGAAQVREDFERLAAFLEAELQAGRVLPSDDEELYSRWSAHLEDETPVDPFDGHRYGYEAHGGEYIIWSSGPDGQPRTDDDLIYDSRSALHDVVPTEGAIPPPAFAA